MISISTKELLYVIEHTPADQNIMLVGKHGIGKSEILTKFYTGSGKKVVPLFLGQMSDPGDIIGLPNKDEETGHTTFMPPYWFPTDGQPIVLFLDELNRARPEILQVVQDLVLNKTLAGRRLPEGSVIISAVNAGEEYTLTDIDPALLSRFNVYRFSPTVTEWISWATRNDVNSRVIDFISMHEDMLDSKFNYGTDSTEKHCDRRSWKRVSDYMNMNDYSKAASGRSVELIAYRKVISGIIGERVGAAFCDYLQTADFLSPEAVLNDFDRSVSTLKNYDILQLMTMTCRICAYTDRLLQGGSVNRTHLAMGLLRYLKYLREEARTANGRVSHENAQFFVGEYETGMYPHLSALINEVPDLEEYVYQIIEESEN